ncbi:hypothetical protein Q604_UNBC14022G0002, partial [human gut metagenome]
CKNTDKSEDKKITQLADLKGDT